MALTEIELLREIHALGNSVGRPKLWPIIRRSVVLTPEIWAARLKSMVDKHLVEPETDGSTLIRLTLLPAGMALIAASGHVCDPQYCQPVEASAAS